MNEILEYLVSNLMSLKYEDKGYSGGTYQYDVISRKHRDMVKTAIVEWYDMYFGAEYGRKIAELEAKVYTYEKIIANSNFAPIIQDRDLPVKRPYLSPTLTVEGIENNSVPEIKTFNDYE